jgi:hypothetical protein
MERFFNSIEGQDVEHNKMWELLFKKMEDDNSNHNILLINKTNEDENNKK